MQHDIFWEDPIATTHRLEAMVAGAAAAGARLIVLPELVSLDTGCVWGRQLTAVRLDTKVARVYQVPGQH